VRNCDIDTFTGVFQVNWPSSCSFSLVSNYISPSKLYIVLKTKLLIQLFLAWYLLQIIPFLPIHFYNECCVRSISTNIRSVVACELGTSTLISKKLARLSGRGAPCHFILPYNLLLHMAIVKLCMYWIKLVYRVDLAYFDFVVGEVLHLEKIHIVLYLDQVLGQSFVPAWITIAAVTEGNIHTYLYIFSRLHSTQYTVHSTQIPLHPHLD
jgi:hypothetical protein